jgi:carboxypeptidase family protein
MAALVSVSPAFAKPLPQQTKSSLTQIHPAKKSRSMVFVDPSGAGVPHTKVTLRQGSGQNEFTAETNDTGEVKFSDLPKGTYELTAISPGFRPFHVSQVKAPYGPKCKFASI